MKSIIWDIGKVLVDFNLDGLKAVLKDKIDLGGVNFLEKIDSYIELESGQISWPTFVKRFNKQFNFEYKEKELLSLFVENTFTVKKDVVDLFYKYFDSTDQFLMSNITREGWNYLAGNYYFLNGVCNKILSFQVKLRKPAPEFYSVGLDLLNLRPENVIFIDDRLENIHGAEEVGIKSFYFRNDVKELDKFIENNI